MDTVTRAVADDLMTKMTDGQAATVKVMGDTSPRHVLAAALSLLIVSGCATVPASRQPTARRESYLQTHRELRPSIARAIADGHVVVGMDRQQVKVVLGDPVQNSLFHRTDGTTAEVLRYPAVRLHQDAVGAEHGTLFRLVLIDGILRIVEPL